MLCMQQEAQGRIKQLDGLRGLAILMVLFVHLFNFGLFSNVFYFGWAGVDLFFVLSGFLITGILLNTRQQEGYFRKFWIRRVLRIFPLYYAVLTVFLLMAPYFRPTAWFSRYQIYFWTYTSNYLVLQKGFFKPLGHFWSLAIEEQFYLCWPIIIWLFKPMQLLVISLLLIVTGILLRYSSSNVYIIYGSTPAHIDGLMVGGMLAVVIRHYREMLFRYIDALCGMTTLLLLVYVSGYVFYWGINGDGRFMRLPFTFTLVSVFFGSVLIMSLKHDWMRKKLSAPLLLFFGKYAYGMYIFNSIFFHISNWAGADRLPVQQKQFVYLGVFLLTVVVSYLSYELFEIRFLRLREKFAGG